MADISTLMGIYARKRVLDGEHAKRLAKYETEKMKLDDNFTCRSELGYDEQADIVYEASKQLRATTAQLMKVRTELDTELERLYQLSLDNAV